MDTPDDTDSLFRAALAAHRAGNLEEAVRGYHAVLGGDPDHAGANNNLGALLNDAGETEAAIGHFEKALATRPDLGETRYVLALAQRQMGRPAEAARSFHLAAELAPADSRPWCGLAALALSAHDYREAGALAEQALARNGEDANAWSLLGITYKEQGQFDDAHVAYDRALSINPDHAEARYNRGALRLLLGDMPDGWADYGWRWHGRTTPGDNLGLPRWDGTVGEGLRLVLVGEQGFGDTIQCLRFLPGLHAQGLTLSIVCRPELHRLVAALPAVTSVTAPGNTVPDADAYLPMMDLPGLLQTDETSIPGADGYLTIAAPPANPDAIGLAWAGSPTHKNDANRSIPLTLLKPLIANSTRRFVSLQMDARGDDIKALDLAGRIEDRHAEVTDFTDTAGIIAGLDLVITVDTAVAHLAGAMGKPVWLLIPFVPDWRWQLERPDSPWYTSARLFRQPAPGDWPAVIDAVRDALGG